MGCAIDGETACHHLRGGDIYVSPAVPACRHAPRGSIRGYAQRPPLPGWEKCPPPVIVSAVVEVKRQWWRGGGEEAAEVWRR